MSLESVRTHLAEHAPDIEVLVASTSTATVALAAAAHGVAPGQIAKTLSLRLGGEVVLLVMRGDARLDNRKYKQRFGAKAKLLTADEVPGETGHPVGGVCPFGLARPLRVYADVSLRAFDIVVPAAGSATSALRIAPERLALLCGAQWVDVAEQPGAARVEASPTTATRRMAEHGTLVPGSPESHMVKVALFVRLEAKPGKEQAVSDFLAGALPLANAESGTTAWFALKFGPSTFGVFDAFADEAGRQAHLNGQIAAALMANAAALLAEAPKIEQVDLLAAKLPG